MEELIEGIIYKAWRYEKCQLECGRIVILFMAEILKLNIDNYPQEPYLKGKYSWHWIGGTLTPLKTNMEPKKLMVSRCFSFSKGPFSGSMLVLGGVISMKPTPPLSQPIPEPPDAEGAFTSSSS